MSRLPTKDDPIEVRALPLEAQGSGLRGTRFQEAEVVRRHSEYSLQISKELRRKLASDVASCPTFRKIVRALKGLKEQGPENRLSDFYLGTDSLLWFAADDRMRLCIPRTHIQ